MKALINKKDFIGLEQNTWFYSGAETPTHRSILEAVTDYMHLRSLGPLGREKNSQTEWNCKKNLAALLNGNPEQIAIMSNTSEVISMISQSLPFQPGDNVIIHVLEFPSGVLPWLHLKQQGVEVRVVEHTNWEIDVDDLLKLVDDKTKLIMTSHVSYLTGARMDYRRLYQELKKTDTLLLLDVTQSLGVVPVDMEMADLVVCSTYKWLLSVHGGGILGVNPNRVHELIPKYVGWRSVTDVSSPNRFDSFTFQQDARKFELGYPSYPTIYALNYSTQILLDVGIEQIEQHVLALGGELINQLNSLGMEVMTPSDSTKRAGNICMVCENAESVADKLFENGVYVMGGDGRLRASIHAFNDSDDIQKLTCLLPGCLNNQR